MGRKPNMIPSTCEKVCEVGRGVCVCVYTCGMHLGVHETCMNKYSSI
jgi:hypothetical protein